MLAAVLELPNFAADQEGFGSLSAALAIAWHGTGDSVLVSICWVVPKAPAPADESLCWLLGGLFVHLPDCTLILPDNRGISLWSF